MKSLESLSLAAITLALLSAPTQAQTVSDDVLTGTRGIAEKMVGLAMTVPEDTYDWRPGEGVRSIGEVYMHVASANFRLPNFLGISPPEGTPQAWIQGDAEGLTREQAVDAMNASFVFIYEVIEQTASNLDAEITFFGRTTNNAGFLIFMEGHLHEHLGQSIAYARTNGVVPPWSGQQ